MFVEACRDSDSAGELLSIVSRDENKKKRIARQRDRRAVALAGEGRLRYREARALSTVGLKGVK